MIQIKILDIVHDSTVDGEGLRIVIYFAGCNHKCNDCHNPQSWDFNAGYDMTVDDIVREIKSNPLCKGITFTGGCPLCNAEEIIPLAKKLKELNYNIWIYCGETLEDLNGKQLELLQYTDVLVDGKYIEEQKDITLKFRGSKNQRILRKGIHYN